MNAACDDQRGHAGLDLLFRELQDHDAAPSSPSNGNWRIKAYTIAQSGKDRTAPAARHEGRGLLVQGFVRFRVKAQSAVGGAGTANSFTVISKSTSAIPCRLITEK